MNIQRTYQYSLAVFRSTVFTRSCQVYVLFWHSKTRFQEYAIMCYIRPPHVVSERHPHSDT